LFLSCTDDADCSAYWDRFCYEGFCRARCLVEGCFFSSTCDETVGCVLPTCAVQEDCPGDTVCAAGGDCLEPCDTQDDCPAGTTCNAGLCEWQFCTPCPIGTACHPGGFFICLGECIVNGCAAGEECNQDTGFCQPAPALGLTAGPTEGLGGNPLLTLTDPSLGAATEVVLSFDAAAGGLQARRVEVSSASGFQFNGFVGPGRPAGSSVATITGDFGMGIVSFPDVVALDQNTAYSDVDGDGIYTPGLDIVAKNDPGASGIALTVTLPKGGDLSNGALTVPANGLIELRIVAGTYETTEVGMHDVSALVTSVDRGTGGARDYIYPEPVQASSASSVEVTPAPAPPPPVPDGDAVPGVPMTVALNANGVDLDVAWDVATCAADDYVALMGDLAAVSSLTLTGAGCALGTDGTATVAVPPGDLFLLLTPVNASGVEGSHGFDGDGAHRTSTAGGLCGISGQSLTGSCP
jgi:hypothetical protein